MQNFATTLIVTSSMSIALSSAYAQVVISEPGTGNVVCALQKVTGTLAPAPTGDADKAVWVVINSMLTPGDYWVQDPGTVEGNGHWTLYVHFGEAGQNVEAPFEFRAFVRPNRPLTVGKTISQWPSATWSSDVVRVTRGACNQG